jgi:hypothetical protein
VRLVTVPAGAQACANGVVFDRFAQAAAVAVDTRGRPGPELLLTAAAPGYSASGSVAPGYADGSSVVATLSPPAPREVGGGSLCVTNRGRHPIGLVGPGDARSRNATMVTVAGRPVHTQFSVTLMAAAPSSLASRPGEVLKRAAAFRPVGRGILWPLTILVLVGVPVLALVAVVTTRPDRRRGDLPPQ